MRNGLIITLLIIFSLCARTSGRDYYDERPYGPKYGRNLYDAVEKRSTDPWEPYLSKRPYREQPYLEDLDLELDHEYSEPNDSICPEELSGLVCHLQVPESCPEEIVLVVDDEKVPPDLPPSQRRITLRNKNYFDQSGLNELQRQLGKILTPASSSLLLSSSERSSQKCSSIPLSMKKRLKENFLNVLFPQFFGTSYKNRCRMADRNFLCRKEKCNLAKCPPSPPCSPSCPPSCCEQRSYSYKKNMKKIGHERSRKVRETLAKMLKERTRQRCHEEERKRKCDMPCDEIPSCKRTRNMCQSDTDDDDECEYLNHMLRKNKHLRQNLLSYLEKLQKDEEEDVDYDASEPDDEVLVDSIKLSKQTNGKKKEDARKRLPIGNDTDNTYSPFYSLFNNYFPNYCKR